ERFERAGVYYACTAVEARLHTEQDVAVVGGGNSAGQAAMFLSEQCKGHKVHLLVRRPLGTSMSEYLVNRIKGTVNIEVHENTEVEEVCGTKRIDTISIVNKTTGEKTSLSCGAAFVFIGAEPRTDWLPKAVARDKFGFVLTGTEVAKSDAWPLKDRDPCPLETTVPRILAGGDVRAGSTKRVGFAVGDGSLAVTCVHKLLAMV
ncbi:MAG: trxB, partial [Phycisphaerales bacterium]|nr:trxB [Phycisphaerales bacterium]